MRISWYKALIFIVFLLISLQIYFYWKSQETRTISVPSRTSIKEDKHLVVSSRTSIKEDKHLVKIIHQSWKSHSLPPSFKHWSKSWKRCYPEWEYKLWSDEENRDLIRRAYPWFLSTYDSFTHNIYRADSMRAFYMHHYGGIYADLDAECLKPFTHLIVNASVVLGAMAGDKNSLVQEGYTQNSFMYSRRGHTLWMYFIHDILQMFTSKMNNDRVSYFTGPMSLMDSIKRYREMNYNDITIYPPMLFNPFSWLQKNLHPSCKDLNRMNELEYKKCRGYFINTSYVVQYHSQSWRDGASRLKGALENVTSIKLV